MTKTEQTCSKCDIKKPLSNFHRDSRSKSGYRSWCKLCIQNSNSLNKDQIRETAKKWKLKNRERVRATENEYRKTTKGKLYIKMHNHRYYLANKEDILKAQSAYITNRESYDEDFKIRNRLRHRIYLAVKRNGTTKSARTPELLGCSIQEVRNHLESQFTEGMSWDNYGKWHIDHIIPCASFNLKSPEKQKECFNYTNLQPLWAYDNLCKGAKLRS